MPLKRRRGRAGGLEAHALVGAALGRALRLLLLGERCRVPQPRVDPAVHASVYLSIYIYIYYIYIYIRLGPGCFERPQARSLRDQTALVFCENTFIGQD